MLERDIDAHIARSHGPVKRCSASGTEPASRLANAGVIEPGCRADSHHSLTTIAGWWSAERC
jgi:hypothetical protein